MQQLHPFDVQDRGKKNLAALSNAEKLVFTVMELEGLSLMEGWDHFFTYSPAFAFYDLMKAGLAAAGDSGSLAILSSYEGWLEKYGVALAADAIEGHLATLSEEDLQRLPDWQGEFDDLTETRWDLIAAHLRREGVELITT